VTRVRTGPTITVRPVHDGRVTRYGVACSACVLGAPNAIRTRDLAIRMAVAHDTEVHDGQAVAIDVLEPSSGRRTRKRGLERKIAPLGPAG
jgi:hypothetical protein